MENNDDNKVNAWDAMLYRLRKEFDPLYVIRDGSYKILVALVFGCAGLILTAFIVGLTAALTGKINL